MDSQNSLCSQEVIESSSQMKYAPISDSESESERESGELSDSESEYSDSASESEEEEDEDKERDASVVNGQSGDGWGENFDQGSHNIQLLYSYLGY